MDPFMCRVCVEVVYIEVYFFSFRVCLFQWCFVSSFFPPMPTSPSSSLRPIPSSHSPPPQILTATGPETVNSFSNAVDIQELLGRSVTSVHGT